MATLTQTAYFARKAVKYGGIALVALIFIRAGYITIKKMIPEKPKPLPPPNIAFGKLPKLQFPENANLPKITYRLETISGLLPGMPTQAKVYFMPQPSSGFLTQEKTEEWAKQIGFLGPGQKSENDVNLLTFISQPQQNATINVNSLNKNFSFSYDWKNDPNFSFQPALGEIQSVSSATQFLQLTQSFPSDINMAKNKIIFLKNDNNNLIESSFEEANFSKVNFFRKTTDEFDILPPDPKNANIYVIVSAIQNNFKGVVEAKYYYGLVSTEINATYPLKDINQAWAQLLEGQGHIANLGNNTNGNVIIRKASLAYYEGEIKQAYLQPIFVFEGDKDFTAYVPAISDNLFAD